jgi:geranylgeranyl reductase family protein
VTPDWDLVVVGAGPAGSAAALGALHHDPSLRVLLLDREEFPRDKPCGDGIAPHVFDALAAVGVEDLHAGWEPLHRFDVTHAGTTAAARMRRPVWVIPRSVFDARLLARATAAGAQLRRHRARTLVRDADRVGVDDLRARVVVGADGAASMVRAALGRRPGKRAIAIRGYAPTPAGRGGLQSIVYGDRRHPSYAWSFDRGDGLANVGYGEFVVDRDDRPTRRQMLAELERLLPGSTAGGGEWRAHHLPLSGWRPEPSADRVLLTGDAAHLVNPMTGEGIYYAVATGLAAGRAAAAALASGVPERSGGLYDDAVRGLLGSHLHHTWAAARLSARPRVLDAGIRAAGRDRRAFDSLVELGLGDGRITPTLAAGLVRELARGLLPRRHDHHPATGSLR